MRIAAWFVVCVLLFSCREKRPLLYPWEEKLTLEQKGLKGKVKSMLEHRFGFIDSNGISQKILTEKELDVFDSSGHLVESNVTTYSAVDSNETRNLYTYRNDFKIVKKEIFDKYSTVPQVITYYYGDKGRDTLEIEQFQNRNFGAKTTLSYDADNRVIEKRHIPIGNFTDSNYIQPYVTRINYIVNNRVEASTFTPDGELTCKCVYKYDKGGNLIILSHYDKSEFLLDKTVFVPSGNNYESITYGRDSAIMYKAAHTEDSPDKYGNATRISGVRNGKLTFLAERQIEYYH